MLVIESGAQGNSMADACLRACLPACRQAARKQAAQAGTQTGFTQHYFNQFLEVLKKNRNKISIDPSDRKTQELLEKQFIKSISILGPLKARIKVTDELIDEIVYRLYGLTKEEIEVIKGKT